MCYLGKQRTQSRWKLNVTNINTKILLSIPKNFTKQQKTKLEDSHTAEGRREWLLLPLHTSTFEGRHANYKRQGVL